MADPVLTVDEMEKVLGLSYFTLIRATGKNRFPGAYKPFGVDRLGWRYPLAGILSFVREMGADEDIVRARIEAIVAARPAVTAKPDL